MKEWVMVKIEVVSFEEDNVNFFFFMFYVSTGEET